MSDTIPVEVERIKDTVRLAIGKAEAFLTIEQVDWLITQLTKHGQAVLFDKLIVRGETDG